MYDNYGNQKGFTLLEVLLSIILLSIILTSFMGFFTQSAMFTKKNEQKLGTSETAQMVINLIDEQVTKDLLVNNSGTMPISMSQDTTISIGKPTLDQLISPSTINSPFVISLELKNNQTSEKLIQIKVTVTDPGNTGDQSETFTYIRR